MDWQMKRADFDLDYRSSDYAYFDGLEERIVVVAQFYACQEEVQALVLLFPFEMAP